MKVEITAEAAQVVRAFDMKLGDVAQVKEPGTYFENFIMRGYHGLISLNNPRNTWGTDCPLKVKILPPGTELTLVVEERK